jgi:putative CocE/NonD family hydrolase
MRRFGFLLVASFLLTVRLHAQDSDSAFARKQYVKAEYRIPMRDGVQLFTIVYVPKDASPDRRYPILLNRTPYAAGPYGPDSSRVPIGPNPFMMRERYIVAYQDVRGRYMSEGTWVNVRPFIEDKRTPRDVDDASDTYDTIEWLLQHVPNHNGRVGQWGISYPGFFTTMGALSRHPALKAVSPQAPVTDFYFEDFHHNGALTQGYFYTYPLFGIQTGGPTPDSWWEPHMVQEGLPDDYAFQLGLGPLSNTTERYYKNNFFWRELVQHPDYDAFWRARAVPPHLEGISAAVMTVGGWFDAEDLYGPLTTYKTIERRNPGIYNSLVMGPFAHGQWAHSGSVHTLHGDIYFGDSLEFRFQRDVEAKFFRHFLKEDGSPDSGLPEAYLFDTGSKEWKSFAAWPAREAVSRRLFLGAEGSLAWTKPRASDGALAYVSDPAKPVPSRCLVPTIQGLTMYQYMSDDQRCFASRPDVLTFESPVLEDDVTLGGEIMAHLVVATTGTDADFVVKLIDVYPPDEKNHPYMPSPNVYLAGYQQMVRSEIMRGRYRRGFDRPTPFRAGTRETVAFRLQDVLHTFRKGHRIMVQVQSSMFPLFDRNPQTFVPNIYQAKASAFRKATQRVFVNGRTPSYLDVQVLPAKNAGA